jgi:hypothetical protein
VLIVSIVTAAGSPMAVPGVGEAVQPQGTHAVFEFREARGAIDEAKYSG